MSDTTAAPALDRETIAQDFAAAMQGKMEPEKIDAAVQKIRATTPSYPATGSVASFVFYLRWHVNVKNGKSFAGNSGGLAIPGPGEFRGDVFTDDINALYARTQSFMFNASVAGVILIFFDGHTNVLGMYQGAGASIVTGLGGGTGKWS